MKTFQQSKAGPVIIREGTPVLANYGGKDLWKRWVLSLEWNTEWVMEGESGEQVGGELESVTSSAECFMQGWRNETGSWFQRWGDA